MQWFRLYHNTVSDPKIAMVARKARAHRCQAGWAWIFVLDFASQAEDRGSVAGLSAELMAVALEIDEDMAQALLDQFEARGMINGGRIAAWDKRQRVSDDVASRVRRHREGGNHPPPNNGGNGRHGDAPDTETVRNGNETLHRDEETLHFVNVTESPLRAQTTDTDSEIESKKEPPLAPPWGDGGELFGTPAPEQEKPSRSRKPRAKPCPRHAEAEIEEAFAKFMAAYPERDTPHCFDTARRTFHRLVNRNGEEPAALVAAATRYRIEAKKRGSAGTHYVMKPNNWLTTGDWKSYHGLAQFPVAPPETGAKDGQGGDQSWRYEHGKVDMDEMREHWKKLGFVQ